MPTEPAGFREFVVARSPALLRTAWMLTGDHSPFMVDSSNLLSCRMVEDATGTDEEVLGTKVNSEVLRASGDTLFPLRAALGYDISQTLFVGDHNLLVEGPSDLLYIQWASQTLAAARSHWPRPALDGHTMRWHH